MINRRTFVVALSALSLMASTFVVHGQDLTRYRDFQLGADLPSISLAAKTTASEAKTLHSRPALIQEMEWRPAYFQTGSTERQTDPVRQIAFTFYNNQLSRMVIDYENDRTAGMTDVDMIEGISTTYGPSLKVQDRNARAVPTRPEDEGGTVIARWGDDAHSLVLYRTSYASGYRLVVTSPRLNALTKTAIDAALRLDDREAPQRDSARLKQEAADAIAAKEKARTTNKATFRP